VPSLSKPSPVLGQWIRRIPIIVKSRPTYLAKKLLDGLVHILVGILEERHNSLGLGGECHGEGPRRGWGSRKGRRVLTDGFETRRRRKDRSQEERVRREKIDRLKRELGVLEEELGELT
jgi:hypothetical protein